MNARNATCIITVENLERLIAAAWNARLHIDTGDGKLNAQLRDELRETCNAARGAVVAAQVVTLPRRLRHAG